MKKYRIYIDESGNNDLRSSKDPNHRYLSLTGVIFELEYADKVLIPDLETLKKKYFGSHPDEPIVLHRKEIMNKKHPFENLRDKATEEKFNIELINLLEKWEFRVISVVIDKLEHTNKYKTWKYDPYHYCIEILVERFYYYLGKIDGCGDVMIESRGGNEDIRLKKSFRRIMDYGTNYEKAEDLKTRITSLELKVKQKYLNIAGLQVADLLAFPSRKHVLKYYERIKDERTTFNDKIIEVIKEKYDRKDNKIEGYGIKMLP